ncbi:MlaD family protein [Flavisolibacter ginsenosidimutans]|uniref:MCE family protein n=1 Tax=Flavisolibacter ginsenosidimutans TaxID=661481 RepID=A0A5B8UNA8_9BACT|nr:MlaD family protein [Flavisolibacter ginsenosidimutans]QEC58053.1 MCE family protein [Flavisolibacter ginsenosidimutans]
MEQKSKRAVIVGAFVFIALVIFVLGVMTLGGQKSLFNKGATIYAYFDEVNGLATGNNVWFAGVKIGTVQDISFDKSGKVKVEMNIAKDRLYIIKKDSKAKVGSDGFIGNKLVVLYGGSASSPVVQDGNTLTVVATPGMEEMMATLQENNKNLLAITGNFKTLSEGMMAGKGTVGKLLNDEKLFTDLQGSILTIKSAAGNAQQMVAGVANYTSQLNRKGSLANDLITDTVVFSRLRSTVQQIDALSDKANDVMVTLNQASQNVQQKLNDNASPAGMLLNDKQAADDIRITIKNLQSSTQKLDENMEALQHNFLLRGFFRKRDKEKEKLK